MISKILQIISQTTRDFICDTTSEEKFKRNFSTKEWEEFKEIILKETGLNDLDYSLGLMHANDRMNPSLRKGRWCIMRDNRMNPWTSALSLEKKSKVKEFKNFTLRLEGHKLTLYPK